MTRSRYIRLPRSRDCMVIPDPFNILEPWEVVVPVPGIGYLQMDDIVVGRNPCYLPSELFIMNAVHVHDLGRVDAAGRCTAPLFRLPPEERAAAQRWFDRRTGIIVVSTRPVRPEHRDRPWPMTEECVSLLAREPKSVLYFMRKSPHTRSTNVPLLAAEGLGGVRPVCRGR
jgi:hypothetical protein